MASLRDRNKLITIKIESSEGTDAAPVVGTDAIMTEGVRVRAPVNNTTTNEHTGYLDSAADIPIGAPIQITFSMYLKGSGTGGTAPEVGVPLRICGMLETLTTPAVGVPTLAIAGSATTLTLPSATFTGADDVYRGMPIILGANPSAGAHSIITTNDKQTGTNLVTLADTYSPSLNATTTAQIPANALYTPVSASIPSATIYAYEDGVLYACVGCRGDFTFQLDAGGKGVWNFTITGRLSAKSDAAIATPTFPGSAVSKIVWNNRNGFSAMLLDRASIAVTQFSIGFGNTIVNPPNPNQTDGFDPGEIVVRNIRGQFNPKATLIATRDLLTAYRDATTVLVAVRAGRAAGNRFACVVYAAQLSGYSEESQGGIMGEMIPFKANGTDAAAMAFAFY